MLSPLYGQLSPLRVPTSMRFISNDADVVAYVLAVEAADGDRLEDDVISAYDAFITGCKTDGIWTALKASCILAGARTLSGALVPLVGSAPTNFNFVSADYDRKNGLLGNGTTKYLDSNRNNNADPQNSQHLSVYAVTAAISGTTRAYIGHGSGTTSGMSYFVRSSIPANITARSRRNIDFDTILGAGPSTGFIGQSRSNSSNYIFRASGSNTTLTRTSVTSSNGNIFVFNSNGLSSRLNSNLSFYSIGESLDLALLDSRVSTLMTALATAIP
jgi:hypothetical protein